MYLLRKDTFSWRGNISKMLSLHNFQVSDSLVDRDSLSHQQRRPQAQCTVGWENISWACQGAPFQLYPRCSFLCGMNEHGGKSSLAEKLILDSFLTSLMCFFPVGGCFGTVVLSNPVVPHRYLFIFFQMCRRGSVLMALHLPNVRWKPLQLLHVTTEWVRKPHLEFNI